MSLPQGATAIDVEWEPTIGEAPFGQPSPLTIDADVNFDPESPEVVGQGLWQLGVFASRAADGAGPRRHEVSQTLDPYNEALPLEDGGPLDFNNINVPNFPIDELGCDDYGFLCVEFKQGRSPQPQFKFDTESGDESIISCKPHACKGILDFHHKKFFF